MNGFLTSVLSWFPVIPAAVLCFAPMKDRLKYDKKGLFKRIAALLILLILISAFVESRLSLYYNAMLPVIAVITFYSYHKCLTVPIEKSLSIYALVFALMSFFCNFSNGFDAAIHPLSTLNDFSIDAGIFQAVLTTAAAAVFFYPFMKYGSRLIDKFDIRRVWFVSLPVSLIFLTYNLLIAPRKYETMHVNNVSLFFWVSLVLLLILLILLCVLSYFIVSGMMDAAETQEKNRILEMQESNYLAQQRYMEETAKVRHDFKHTIGILESLVAEGDLAAVKDYLDSYLASQPKKETASFCHNTAVNALLNYYMGRAQMVNAGIEWEISLPENLSISDIDLCGILGNILENAVLACRNLKEEDRFIDLTVRHDASGLLIVATNSFDGRAEIKDGHYLSTKSHGSGIGLKSIASTAEKYGGSAKFSHMDGEFYSDVVIPLKFNV